MRTTTSALILSVFFNRYRQSWSACFGILWLNILSTVASALPLPMFPDPNLQACFDEQAASQGWVNAEGVRELVCVERGIQDIYGIDQLSSLASLDLNGNLIDNLYPLGYMGLAALSELVSLRLADNAIVDVYPLQGYIALKSLWLSGNSGIDFQQLRPVIDQNPYLVRLGLGDIDLQEPVLPWFNIDTTAIIELDVSNTGLEGLRGRDSYQSLQVLDVSANSLFDIWPLFYVPELEYADLRDITTIPCDQLDQLELTLGANAVLRPLTCMP